MVKGGGVRAYLADGALVHLLALVDLAARKAPARSGRPPLDEQALVQPRREQDRAADRDAVLVVQELLKDDVEPVRKRLEDGDMVEH